MGEKKCVRYKDPNATLDYGFDWTDWLNGDTISGSTWVVPTGLTEVSKNYTNVLATIWLSEGTAGSVYTLVNRITTVGGRTEDRTMTIIMRNR